MQFSRKHSTTFVRQFYGMIRATTPDLFWTVETKVAPHSVAWITTRTQSVFAYFKVYSSPHFKHLAN